MAKNGNYEPLREFLLRQMVIYARLSYTLFTSSGSFVMPNSILDMRHAANLSGSGREPISLYLYHAIRSRD